MRCPYCRHENSRVVDTSHDARGGVRRRRECEHGRGGTGDDAYTDDILPGEFVGDDAGAVEVLASTDDLGATRESGATEEEQHEYSCRHSVWSGSRSC